MFDDSFLYEVHEADALTFNFTVGELNPNDAVNAHMPIKDDCAVDERPDGDECSGANRPKVSARLSSAPCAM